MSGLDHAIAGLSGGGLLIALAVALLLGLRHATDPDHLTAVSTLVMSERRGRAALAGTGDADRGGAVCAVGGRAPKRRTAQR